jgi:hypothetical protein
MGFIAGITGGTAAGTATTGSVVIPTAGRVPGYTCVVSVASNVSITSLAGFTLAPGSPTTNTASAGRMNTYYKVLNGTETSVTITPSASARWSYVSAVFDNPGIDTATGSTSTTSSTTSTAPTVTAAASGSILVSSYGCIGNATTVVPSFVATSGAQNEIGDVGNTSNNRNPAVMMAYEALASSGATGTRTATVSTATQNGSTSLVLQPTPVTTLTQAAFRFYEDGTETGSTATAAQSTNITRTVTSNSNIQVRTRIQESTAGAGASTDDYQLQYSHNSSLYVNVNTGTIIDGYDFANRSSFVSFDDTVTLNAQSFTGNGKPIGSATFLLSKIGTLTGNATAKVYSHSGTFGTSSVPNTLLATSDTYDSANVGYTWAAHTLTFSGVNQITSR